MHFFCLILPVLTCSHQRSETQSLTSDCENSTMEATIPFMAEFLQSSSGKNVASSLNAHLHLLLKDAGTLQSCSSCFPKQEITEGIPVPSLYGPSTEEKKNGSQGEIPCSCFLTCITNRKSFLSLPLAWVRSTL